MILIWMLYDIFHVCVGKVKAIMQDYYVYCYVIFNINFIWCMLYDGTKGL